MSIDFRPYSFDSAIRMWRLPEAASGNPDAFEINVSNANGYELQLVLGLDPEADGEPMAIEAFSGLVTAALRRHLGERSPAVQSYESGGAGQMTIIHCGRAEGYIERRLGEIARLIQDSRAIGATHIGWG